MDCPKCHTLNALRVINTEHRPDGTHRWRRCIKCRFAQRTLERPYSPKPGPIPGTMMSRPKAAGSRNGNAVLTEQDVQKMRQRAAEGVSGRQLAIEHGVAPETVSRIVNHKTWTHVK